MRTWSYIALAAITAFILSFVVSCSKEQDVVVNSTEKVSINFTAYKIDSRTKTAIDSEGDKEASYKWTTEDTYNIKLFLISAGVPTEVTETTVTKVSDTEISISATVDVAASYTFRAILGNAWQAIAQPKVKSSQSPKADSYDPQADIFVSNDLVVTDPASPGIFSFTRKGVINKMTLKSIDNGDKINRIEISSTANLTGYWNGSDIVGNGNKIILNYDDVTVSGDFPVYFTTIAGSGHTLTVEVTTDKKTYTHTFGDSGIHFDLGKMTRFSVTMPAGVAVTRTWTRVTNAASLADGNVIVIGKSDGTYALGTTQNTNNRNAISTSSSDAGATISHPSGVQDISLEGSSGAWYFKVGTDSYLYAAGSGKGNNYLKSDTKTNVGDNGKWAISIDSESGVATITAQGTNTNNLLKKNSSSELFSCYSSGQQDVAIYKEVVSGSTKYPTTWTLSGISVVAVPTKTLYHTGETLDVTGMVVKASYIDAGNASNTKEVFLDNASLTFSPTLETGLVPANTEVTISYGGQNTTLDITVEKATPTLVVSPSSPISVTVGGTKTLSVSGSDGAKSFESDDETVATVTSEGVVSGAKAGSAHITITTAATSNYNAGSTTVTVNVIAVPTYTLQSSSLSAGTYVIACLNSSKYYFVDGNSTSSGLGVETTGLSTSSVSDGSFQGTSLPSNAIEVTLTADGEHSGYFFISNGDDYIYATSSKGSITWSDENTSESFQPNFTANAGTDGCTLVGLSGSKVSQNGTTKASYIRNYASNGSFYNDLYFFKKN